MDELGRYCLNASYANLESQVRNNNYYRIGNRIWGLMVESGITKRWGDNWSDYRYTFLQIPYSDVKALMDNELLIVQKYQDFGIYVSALFPKHDVIVDTDEGKVIVIKCS